MDVQGIMANALTTLQAQEVINMHYAFYSAAMNVYKNKKDAMQVANDMMNIAWQASTNLPKQGAKK